MAQLCEYKKTVQKTIICVKFWQVLKKKPIKFKTMLYVKYVLQIFKAYVMIYLKLFQLIFANSN